MKRLIALVLFCLVFAAAHVRAADDDWLVVGGLDLAFKSLALNAGGSSSPDTTTLLSTMTPNVALARGRFYTSLSLDEVMGQQPKTFQDGGLPQTLAIGRQGIDFTVGYRIFSSVGIFGGWQNNHIHAVTTGLRNVGGTLRYSVLDADYSTNGPFLGASWSHGIGKKGTLGLTVAYAQLPAEESETRTTDNGTSTPTVSSLRTSFTTKGFSYGVTWTGDLTGSLAYRVGIKATQYDSGYIPALTSSIKDQYTSLFFGISNYF